MRKIIMLGAILAGTAAAAAPAAQGVELNPTTISIGAGSTAGAVAITNNSTAPLNLRVSAFAWTNAADGEMQLAGTDDLIVFPTTLVVEPHETRRVRVGARKPEVTAKERAFRIVLEEAAVSRETASAGLAMRMRFNLPVFLEPKDRRAAVSVLPPVLDAMSVRVTLQNVGVRHVTPRSIEVTGRDAAGRTAWSYSLPPWYLLAGESRAMTKSLTPDECRATAVVAANVQFLENASLSQKTEQRVGPAACTSR